VSATQYPKSHPIDWARRRAERAKGERDVGLGAWMHPRKKPTPQEEAQFWRSIRESAAALFAGGVDALDLLEWNRVTTWSRARRKSMFTARWYFTSVVARAIWKAVSHEPSKVTDPWCLYDSDLMSDVCVEILCAGKRGTTQLLNSPSGLIARVDEIERDFLEGFREEGPSSTTYSRYEGCHPVDLSFPLEDPNCDGRFDYVDECAARIKALRAALKSPLLCPLRQELRSLLKTYEQVRCLKIHPHDAKDVTLERLGRVEERGLVLLRTGLKRYLKGFTGDDSDFSPYLTTNETVLDSQWMHEGLRDDY